jgi:serine/threonine protein kinase
MAQEVPRVNSVQDLHPLCEVFHLVDSQPVFSRSTFAFVTEDYHVYFGEAAIRKKALTPQDIRGSLKYVPDEEVYPKAKPHITIISNPVDDNVYVKGPKLTNYDNMKGTGVLPKLLLQEAETLEILMRNPHPHIVRYHGCIVERGYIVGIVLDRHPTTLQYGLQDGPQNFDAKSCIDDVASGVKHLHSLELAHNDLTPMNILLNNDGKPVIADLGSCQPFGKGLITAGTPGWIDEEFTTSEQKHDEIG